MSAVMRLAVMALLFTACATHALAPIGAGGGPFRPEADEIALWARADKEAQSLLERAKTYDDPALDEYLARLVERLVPEPVRAAGLAFEVRVLRDPTLNAFALPNGRLFVHTGLLSALGNEAQLAAVLAHEITHVTRRHALQADREPGTGHGSAAALELIAAAASRARDTAVLSPTAGAILGLGLPLATVASIFGYGRAFERQADGGGVDAMARAGYDPREARRLFQRLREETAERGPLEIFFFGTRARLGERVDATRALSRAADAERAWVEDTGEFQARMRPVGRDNAYEDLRAGRFALAQRQLDRVLAATQDAVAHLYCGDLHRLRAQRARDLEGRAEHERRALSSYERAADLDPALAEVHRQLGLLYYQQRDVTKARAAFERYLALAPGAPDAGRIGGYIAELGR